MAAIGRAVAAQGHEPNFRFAFVLVDRQFGSGCQPAPAWVRACGRGSMRGLFASAFVTFVVALGLAPAHAGTIWRHCEGDYCTLEFGGEIVRGDAALLTSAVRSAPHVVQMVEFNSPGGDPFEAMAMADIINIDFIAVSTATCDRGQCDGLPLSRFGGGSSCASACSLIFLAANTRYGTEVYLHRPTFPPGMFAALSGPNAENAYNQAVDRLLAGLRKRRVPDDIIQQIMGMPSEGLVKLQAWYPSNSVWMTEWLTAKCGPGLQGGVVDPDVLATRAMCQADVIAHEQRRAQVGPPKSDRR
jgi:hypothetical protein